ncbi:unnamed protein product, partial [Candidula unifasciata]
FSRGYWLKPNLCRFYNIFYHHLILNDLLPERDKCSNSFIIFSELRTRRSAPENKTSQKGASGSKNKASKGNPTQHVVEIAFINIKDPDIAISTTVTVLRILS